MMIGGIVLVLTALAALALGAYLNENQHNYLILPECYSKMPPNPQHQAERDCPNCAFQDRCFFQTFDRPPP